MARMEGLGTVGLAALAEAHRDPHHLFDALRERQGISWDASSGSWLVTDHAVVRGILADPRFAADLQLGGPPGSPSFLDAAIRRQIIFLDGEKQRRVHRIILREFARRAQELAPALRELAGRLLADVARRGVFDVVSDFAVPYSLEAVALMVGVPVDDPAQLALLERWSSTYANVTSGYLRGDMDDIVRLGDYFRRLVDDRRGAPGDDLIGAFIREAAFDDGEELVVNCMMAFAAGRITTQKLLGNGIPLLLPAWPAWRRESAGNAGFCRRLTEELLRLVTPTGYVVRHAAEDVELEDAHAVRHRLPRGARVVLFLQAANRDPRLFADPHDLNAERQPNPHLTFSHGPHRCPGAALARLEIQVALESLLETFAELRAHPWEVPAWHPNPNIGGYSHYLCQGH